MRKIRKNDEVMVISGKYRGRKAKVQRAFPDRDYVIVEGVNMVKRHMRPTQQVRQAGIVEKEAPIHVSNVKLVCKKCNQPARVGFTYLEDGSKVRVCRNCQEVID